MLAAVFLVAVDLSAQGRVQRPMTFEDFRRGEKCRAIRKCHPMARWVLYSVRTTDVNANKRTTVTIIAANHGQAAVDGASIKAGSFRMARFSATEARWSPDGKRIAYIAGGQLWIADVDWNERASAVDVNGGAGGPGLVSDGRSHRIRLRRLSRLRQRRLQHRAREGGRHRKVKAHIADNLLYRHWTEWTPETRSHLFVVAPMEPGFAM